MQQSIARCILNSEKIILFDGFCNLCSALVVFLLKADRKRQFKFTASQSKGGIRLIQTFKLDNVNTSIYYIDGEKVYDRSQAIFHITSALGFPYSIMLIFGILGRPINDGLYSLIARIRIKLFGRRKSCMRPSDANKHRFID